MKIKHYLILILTLLSIAFLQPLILLLGGITLLGGMIAFVYADMPPESQRAWELRITGLLKQLQSALSRQPQPADSSGDQRQPLDRSGRRELMPRLEAEIDEAGNATTGKAANGNSRNRRAG